MKNIFQETVIRKKISRVVQEPNKSIQPVISFFTFKLVILALLNKQLNFCHGSAACQLRVTILKVF